MPAPNEYVTALEPAPRVSTSPKKGAMMARDVVCRGNGVYVERGLSKVTFPLLFTYSAPYVVPKKLRVKGSATTFVDPSSLGGSTVSRHASLPDAVGSETIASGPSAWASLNVRRAAA